MGPGKTNRFTVGDGVAPALRGSAIRPGFDFGPEARIAGLKALTTLANCERCGLHVEPDAYHVLPANDRFSGSQFSRLKIVVSPVRVRVSPFYDLPANECVLIRLPEVLSRVSEGQFRPRPSHVLFLEGWLRLDGVQHQNEARASGSRPRVVAGVHPLVSAARDEARQQRPRWPDT
jgi:hypothetical protein